MLHDALQKKYEGIFGDAYAGRGGMRWVHVLGEYAAKKVQDVHGFNAWFYKKCKVKWKVDPEDALETLIQDDIEDQMQNYMNENGEWPSSYKSEMCRIRNRAPVNTFNELIRDYNIYLAEEKPVEDAIKNANTQTGLNTDF